MQLICQIHLQLNNGRVENTTYLYDTLTSKLFGLAKYKYMRARLICVLQQQNLALFVVAPII